MRAQAEAGRELANNLPNIGWLAAGCRECGGENFVVFGCDRGGKYFRDFEVVGGNGQIDFGFSRLIFGIGGEEDE